MAKWEIEGQGQLNDFGVKNDGNLYFKNRLCVSGDSQLKQKILLEAHNSMYSVHPGSTKMYCDLKQRFWRLGMKHEVFEFVAKCLVC